MQSLNLTLKMERDGHDFYTQSAQVLHSHAAQQIAIELARDEKQHELYLLQMKTRKQTITVQTHLSQEIKNVLSRLCNQQKPFMEKDNDLTHIFTQAIRHEQQCITFYHTLEKNAFSDDRKFWKQLRTIESRHKRLLSLILKYPHQPCVILEKADFLFGTPDQSNRPAGN